MTTLCTAGHVDHGKSALVQALTGVDPDRLPEERRRGMTIELGFIDWRLSAEARVSVIDVPGHRSLIRTMAAGAQSVDGVLLVVSAIEGVMPQTREHLMIGAILGGRPVIGVISMIDRVDPLLVAQRAREVEHLIRAQGLEVIGVVACSALTRQGLGDVTAAVARLVDRLRPRDTRGQPRLHVDRAFVGKGHGVIVTGTLLDGNLALGDRVRVLPGGMTARVRRIEHHGEAVEVATPGTRSALNLHGVRIDDMERGQTIVRGAVEARSTFGATLRCLTDSAFAFRSGYVLLHHGTRSCRARLRVLGHSGAEPGTTGFATLTTDVPIVAFPGDRFLLRSTSADRTLGGGTILDLAPRGPAADLIDRLARRRDGGAEDVISDEIDRADSGVALPRLAELAGVSQSIAEQTVAHLKGSGAVVWPVGDRVLSTAAARRLRTSLTSSVTEYHHAFPWSHGMPMTVLHEKSGDCIASQFADHLVADGDLEMPTPGVLALPGWAPDTHELGKLESWLCEQGLEPASPTAVSAAGFSHDIYRQLVLDGRALPVGNGIISVRSCDAARAMVRDHIDGHGPSLTGDLCRAMGVSRRVGIPVLEAFDVQGSIRRVGDYRVLAGREREGNDPSKDAASAPSDRFEDGGAHLNSCTPIGHDTAVQRRPTTQASDR